MSSLDLKLSVTGDKLLLEAMSFKGSIWLLCNVPAGWSEEEERPVPVTVDVSECQRLCALAIKAGLQVVAKSETDLLARTIGLSGADRPGSQWTPY